jgi:hypothetical protein
MKGRPSSELAFTLIPEYPNQYILYSEQWLTALLERHRRAPLDLRPFVQTSLENRRQTILILIVEHEPVTGYLCQPLQLDPASDCLHYSTSLMEGMQVCIFSRPLVVKELLFKLTFRYTWDPMDFPNSNATRMSAISKSSGYCKLRMAEVDIGPRAA